MPIPEKTIPYKTYIKETLVEGLSSVFADHKDEYLRTVNSTIEFPRSKAQYPSVIVRFFEREIHNAGVGHSEYLTIDGADYKFQHYMYNGDIEFAVHDLTSLGRDLISDTIVQTLAMGQLSDYTRRFHDRLYADTDEYPKAEYNFIALNTDVLSGFGETQTPVPWQAEDELIYQTSYRCGISGEFYSLPPETAGALGYVEEVNFYPYLLGIEPVPDGTDDPAEWLL